MANRESSHDRRPQNEDSATNHSEDFRYEEPEELEYEEYDEYDDYEEYDDDEDDEENASLFAMSEDELEERPGVNWLSVLSAVVAVVVAIILAVVGVRSFAWVNANADYAGHSWVVQGTYQDLTPDLITKENVRAIRATSPPMMRSTARRTCRI